MLPSTLSALSHEERKYLVAIVLAGFISTLSASALLSILLYDIKRDSQRNSPIKVFYMSLLFWDIIQGSSSMLNIRWIQHGQIVTGDFCVAQAIVKQLANTGTALSILFMACCIFHDYVIESSGPRHPWTLSTGAFGIGIISLIQVVDIALPNGLLHGSHHYYGISGYWCWISSDHFTTKIVTEYLWFWIAWLFSFLTAMAFYVSVRNNTRLPAGFFWIGFPIGGDKLLRLGLFSIDKFDPVKGRLKWSFSLFEVTFHGRTFRVMLPIPLQYLSTMRLKAHRMRLDQNTSDHALKLLSFPLAYLLLIGPLSVVRFLGFRGHTVGFRVTIGAALVFAFSGFVDVMLYFWARPAFGVSPVDPRSPASPPTISTGTTV